MKKTYYAPSVKTHLVEGTTPILAGSGTGVKTTPEIDDFGDGGVEDLDGETVTPQCVYRSSLCNLLFFSD